MAMDLTPLIAQGREFASHLRELDAQIGAVSDSDSSARKSVEERIAAQDNSGVAEKILNSLRYDRETDQDRPVPQAAAIWLNIVRTIERELGPQLKAVVDAQIAQAKADRPEVNVNEDEVRKLREERKDWYTKLSAIREFVSALGQTDDPDYKACGFEDFKGLRGPISKTKTGKRVAKGLVYSVNGEEVKGSENSATGVAKKLSVSPMDFKQMLMKAANVTEETVGNIDNYPPTFEFDVQNDKGLHSVRVFKQEVDDEDADEGDEVED